MTSDHHHQFTLIKNSIYHLNWKTLPSNAWCS